MAEALNFPRVVLFGGSTTQLCFSYTGGWGAILANKLTRRCDVLARGFDGYNTRFCRLVLPQLFPSSSDTKGIVAFVIFLGSNDSRDQNCDSHVPLDEFQENLENMVDYLQSVGVPNERVIMVGPQGIHKDMYTEPDIGKDWNVGHCNQSTDKYSRMCKSVARKRNVEFLDLFRAINKQTSQRLMFCDGLHLSREGSKLLVDLLWPAIRSRTCHLPMLFPPVSRIDADHPWKAIVASHVFPTTRGNKFRRKSV